MAGEEVVGGIVGYLRLDADDFHREITRAIAEVKVLKGMDAKVDVSVRGARSAERDLLKVGAAAKTVDGNVGGMRRSFGGLGGGGMMSPQVIVGGLAAGMALLGPVTAAATAATVGLTAVVGGSVLAFQGFKREVEDNTALGQEMSRELDGLKASLEGLAATAARASSGDVLAGFRDLRSYLPSLNDDVEELASRLGRAFRTSTGGLISGLENAMPLLQDGGRYAEILANKFAEFTRSQEFKDFVEYARKALPDVASNLTDLAIGLGKITVAMAPVGDQLVALIGFMGQLAEAAAPVIGLFAKANQLTLAGVINNMEDWVGLNEAAVSAVDKNTSATANLAAVQTPLAAGLGTTDKAIADLAEKNDKAAAKTGDATLQMQLQGDAAGLLKQQLDLLNGKQLNVAQAQTSAASATLGLTKSLKENGTTLSTNTQKGVENRQAIEQKIAADQALAEATAKATGSTKAGTESLRTSKAQLEDTLRSQGKLTDKVQAYIDKLYAVPKKVPPTKLEVQTAQGLASIKAFQKALDSLHANPITQSVRYVYEGRRPNGGVSTQGGQTFADGGVVRSRIPGYAGGTIVGPGSGRSDSILAGIAGTQEMIRISNGEFISTDASRRRNQAALEAGNRGATLTAAGDAAGIDYGRLGAELRAALAGLQLVAPVSSRQIDAAMAVGW